MWLDCRGITNRETIRKLQKYLNTDFPKSFLDMISKCDGGYPIKHVFNFFDIQDQEMSISVIGSYLFLDSNSSLYDSVQYIYDHPPEFFPKNILAFADTGSGDLICFDYRQGKNNDNPPIVYWNHEAEEGKDVSFVANNFEEFLGMLYEPQDDEL